MEGELAEFVRPSTGRATWHAYRIKSACGFLFCPRGGCLVCVPGVRFSAGLLAELTSVLVRGKSKASISRCFSHHHSSTPPPGSSYRIVAVSSSMDVSPIFQLILHATFPPQLYTAPTHARLKSEIVDR